TPRFIAALQPLVRDEFPALADAFQAAQSIKRHRLESIPIQLPQETANSVSGKNEKRRLDTADAEPFYLNNAGLVLAHPFIEPLMQRVGLIGDEIPFSIENKAQAAILLHYLVQASPVREESMLVLNKILSGLYPESFVNPDGFEWTPWVKQECTDV